MSYTDLLIKRKSATELEKIAMSRMLPYERSRLITRLLVEILRELRYQNDRIQAGTPAPNPTTK